MTADVLLHFLLCIFISNTVTSPVAAPLAPLNVPNTPDVQSVLFSEVNNNMLENTFLRTGRY